MAKIKETSLYKLLDNPQVIGVELGHETIIEIMNLIQNSGLLTKKLFNDKSNKKITKKI